MGRRKSRPSCFGSYWEPHCEGDCGYESACEEEYGNITNNYAVLKEEVNFWKDKAEKLEKENEKLKNNR